MFHLPHRCYLSGDGPAVHPKNWQSKNASVKQKWYISYRFYDPSIPARKQVMLKGSINEFKDTESRQAVVRTLLGAEIEMLQQGYNPVKNVIIPVERSGPGEMTGDTPFMVALRFALSIKQCETTVKTDMESVLKYFEQSAIMMGRAMIPVKDIRRKDVRIVLDNCATLMVTNKNGKSRKKVWNNNQFNHFRKYISILYSELEQLEIVEYNPCEKIIIKETIQRLRDVLTTEQRHQVHEYLAIKDPNFLRFINIFFHSGSRRSELFKLQGKSVDLGGQRFKTIVQKGRRKREVWKTIKDVAMPYWEEQMKQCAPDDFVFGVGFLPSKRKILPEYATRQWRRKVKDSLGITADLYSLKHLNTTETIDYIQDDTAAQLAAEHNSHTSTAMVVNIYDVKNAQRRHKRIKEIKNSFA